jgi:hypothetical protein
MTTKATRDRNPITGQHYKTPTLAEQEARNNPIVNGQTYYTEHGGKPTTDAEWAIHNYGVGRFYATRGIPIAELETDWPEVFSNTNCMRGFREDMPLDAEPPPGGWPEEDKWPLDEVTGQPIPPWRKP